MLVTSTFFLHASVVKSVTAAVLLPLSYCFRGIDLAGTTVGIAFVGTMCRTLSSLGLTQDGGRSLTSVVSTAAHELGHILNMNHYDEIGKLIMV